MAASKDQPTYFDNHATTAVDLRVMQAMIPTFQEAYGNPESAHAFGWRAKMLVDKARAQTAALIGARENEIQFTSGATASLQRAILGTLDAKEGPAHIITCATEHKATLDTCAEAERRGHQVTILAVDHEGRVKLDQIRNAFRANTALVSLMHGNNEIGTLHPIKEIGELIRRERPDIYFHVDAAQTAGRHKIDVETMNVDLLSLSAHKFHGPKGVGALYVRSSSGRRIEIHHLGDGTPNVSGIVGLGVACEIATDERAHDFARMTQLRELILASLEKTFGVFGDSGLRLNGPRHDRLCNNISLTLQGVEADELMMQLEDFAYSSASACTGPTQSHVLKAIGQATDNPFFTTVRFGLSRLTTDQDVSSLIEKLIAGIEKAREISKAYEIAPKGILKA